MICPSNVQNPEGKHLSASKYTLNYEKETYGNKNTDSQILDIQCGDVYLKPYKVDTD